MALRPASRPSAALRAVQAAVRAGLIPRGYSWLFAGFLPGWFWGGQAVQVQTEVGQMILPTYDRSAASLLCFGHAAEQRESRLVMSLASEAHVMFDIGAHYGWYMRLMAKSAPEGRIFAFEPDPETCVYLAQNAKATTNATVLELAIGSTSGVATLWRSSSRNLSSTVRRVGSPVSVKMISIDHLCQERGIGTVDFIKCDVEGAEIEVLRGAEWLLASERPPIWMLEVIDPFLDEIHLSEDDLVGVFKQAGDAIRMYSQNDRGQPVPIKRVVDRRYGNNIFVVPASRQQDFERAAARI